MLVEEIMNTSVPTLTPSHTINDAITLLKVKKIRHLPIINKDREVVGVVTDRDLKEATPSTLQSVLHNDIYERPLEEIMTKNPITGHPLDFVEETASIFYDNRIGCLPIVSKGKAGSPVVDVKLENLGSTTWTKSPQNYTKEQELGIISARDALKTSQNLSTIRLYDLIMDRKPTDFLYKMGFEHIEENEYANHALSIGGMTNGATVEENTNAFGTFANNGQFIDAYMIEKIEDVDGNIIYQHKTEPVQVFSPATSYIITDMLRDVLSDGTSTAPLLYEPVVSGVLPSKISTAIPIASFTNVRTSLKTVIDCFSSIMY